MSRLSGSLYVCDRCGKEKFFKRQDSGFVVAPEGWVSHLELSTIVRAMKYDREVTFCPECEALYQELLDDFFGVDKKGTNNGAVSD